MRAIILAAGRGSRMKTLTDDQPKCLVELRGKKLLDWQIDSLMDAGVTEISIVTGYKRELLASRGLVEFYNTRWASTNMVSSLCCAQSWLEQDTCVVSYSDIFYSSTAVQSLIKDTSNLALTYDPNWLALWSKRFGDPLLDAETFQINSENMLTEIGNKPTTVHEVKGQYMGLLKFSPVGWAEVLRIRSTLNSDQCDSMHMTGTLQKIIDAGRISITAIPYQGEWGEIDSADDLAGY